MQLLLDDGDEHVGAHGAPDLRLHRVLAGADEFLDAQVLLDPLEEQFDLSALLVQGKDGHRWQRGVVGQEHKRLARIGVFEADAPHMLGVIACVRSGVDSDHMAKWRDVLPEVLKRAAAQRADEERVLRERGFEIEGYADPVCARS